MTTEILTKILYLCVGDDELRPQFDKPFIYNNQFVCATNAHIMVIAAKGENIYPDYSNGIEKILNQEKNINRSINVADFRSKLIPVMIDEIIYKECEDCKGDGGEECNLYHWHECKKCDGYGEIETATGKKIAKGQMACQLFKVQFAYKYLDKLLTIAELQNTEEIIQVRESVNSANFFQVGEVRVIVRPVINQESELIVYNV